MVEEEKKNGHEYMQKISPLVNLKALAKEQKNFFLILTTPPPFLPKICNKKTKPPNLAIEKIDWTKVNP